MFPRRKHMFCLQAVCKTIVTNTCRVLLPQRRRWINPTIHKLFELVVRNFCGTFCFSMQFVIGMDLMGTLVLPAAISFTLYLIIISIISGGAHTTISLVLLAIILGLPSLLIVVTTRKVAYVGWVIVYLLSLPIWNGLLPAYAFWHLTTSHGIRRGKLQVTRVATMMVEEWGDWTVNNRHSMASNSDVNHNGGVDSSMTESTPSVPYASGTRPRHDSNGLLTLPAPLSPTAAPHPINDLFLPPQDQYIDSYIEAPTPRYPQFDAHVARAGGVLRNQTISSQYPGETQNLFRSEPHVATYDDQYGGYSAEPEDTSPPPAPSKGAVGQLV
ncbi:chitin synthase-domain-containing protein [Suillus occidentalis]|nr:chitin synthase-domain-containing protein [Suillus occidentalis]